jgi:hypothetical protein
MLRYLRRPTSSKQILVGAQTGLLTEGSMPAKSNSRMFSSKAEHDSVRGVEAGQTCNLNGREVPLGSTKCEGKDSYTCGKNGWYKDGGKCP